MHTDILYTGVIGFIATIVSGWASWFFTRKKYYSEVNNTLIQNMQGSLDFYKKLSDDTDRRITELLKRNETLEAEVNDLRNQMFSLVNSVCVDLSCQLRKRDTLIMKNKQ